MALAILKAPNWSICMQSRRAAKNAFAWRICPQAVASKSGRNIRGMNAASAINAVPSALAERRALGGAVMACKAVGL